MDPRRFNRLYRRCSLNVKYHTEGIEQTHRYIMDIIQHLCMCGCVQSHSVFERLDAIYPAAKWPQTTGVGS